MQRNTRAAKLSSKNSKMHFKLYFSSSTETISFIVTFLWRPLFYTSSSLPFTDCPKCDWPENLPNYLSPRMQWPLLAWLISTDTFYDWSVVGFIIVQMCFTVLGLGRNRLGVMSDPASFVFEFESRGSSLYWTRFTIT